MKTAVRAGVTTFVLGLWFAVWWSFVLPMHGEASPQGPQLSDERSAEP